jgi:hypothetical protein
VAVWTPNELPHGLVASDKYVSVLRRMVSRIQRSLNHFMALLFSEDTSLGNGQWTFCEVKVDADGFSKHFVHTFRQYNLRGDEFLPGKLKNYNDTIGDLDKARSGLTSEDVQARRRVVGPNTIQMPKPTFWGGSSFKNLRKPIIRIKTTSCGPGCHFGITTWPWCKPW